VAGKAGRRLKRLCAAGGVCRGLPWVAGAEVGAVQQGSITMSAEQSRDGIHLVSNRAGRYMIRRQPIGRFGLCHRALANSGQRAL